MIPTPHFPLRSKTTMRIGGTAAYFAELATKSDMTEAVHFAKEKHIPLLPLGSGSNTIFSDGEINALVVQIKHDTVAVEGQTVTVGAGKNLPMLINELAERGLDLSALTGIPGSVGGAIFGNAGQGPKDVWIDSFVESVTAFVDGTEKVFTKEACEFHYRESIFKHLADGGAPPIIWEVMLRIPSGDPVGIKKNIQALLQKRIETQPHARTAGSCFKAVGGTPAWQLIDAAGLRGYRVGDIEISTKHANFLLSGEKPTFQDAIKLIETVKERIPKGLEVEMRCVEEDGSVRF